MNRRGRTNSRAEWRYFGLALLIAAAAVAPVQAQQPGVRPPSGRPSAIVTTGVHYQRFIFEDADHIEEISLPIYAEVPLGSATSMSLRTSPATVRGRGLEPVAGLSDAQFSVSHFAEIAGGSVVVSLGMNLPSGKRALTQDEFETTVLLSRNFYDFRTPAFGQGFNVSPGFTWAVPLSENLVIGIGAAYQYKGAFEPIEEMEADYQPGAEVLLTGGLDVRLMPATALSGDVTITRYGADEIDGESVFESGNQIVTTIQFLKYWGFDELRVIGRYRSRARGNLVAPGADPTPAIEALPNQMDVEATYRMRTGPAISIGLQGGVHFFDETDVYSSMLLVSAGVTPQMSVGGAIDLWTRFAVRVGEFTGVETAAGLAFRL